MDMPRPDENHAVLERLVGTWVGEEHMPPSQWCPEPTTGTGTSEVRSALGGFGVICDYRQEMNGETTYSGHGVYTYDAQESSYRLHWFDSMGMGVDIFKGRFEGDLFVMQSHGPMGYMRMTSDYSVPGKLSSKMENSQDGENWTVMFTGEYRKT